MGVPAPTTDAGADRQFLDRLEQAKLDALKELAYGASHEINNPLANIAARAQTLLRDEVDPERRRALEAIHQQALRAHEMISDLMLFARPPRVALGQVDVREILRQVERELAPECRRRDVNLHVAVDAGLPPIVADANQLAAALKALCTNSLEAIGQGGNLHVDAHTPSDRRGVRIVVSDDGPGIAPSMRPHVFDPFFSGREAGRGLGFGLSKCWRIISQLNGTIELGDDSNAGARISIHLPANPGAS
jgi:signal transduction histidine kinase